MPSSSTGACIPSGEGKEAFLYVVQIVHKKFTHSITVAFHRAGIDREYQRIYNTGNEGATDRRLAHEKSQKVMTVTIEPGNVIKITALSESEGF